MDTLWCPDCYRYVDVADLCRRVDTLDLWQPKSCPLPKLGPPGRE